MVERLYPGVYVTEVASGVKPIDGVATSTADTAALQAASHARLPHTPDWTNHNDSDPGVTLLQMFGWLSESTLFAARPHPAGRVAHLPAGWGVAEGVAVDGVDTGGNGKPLRVSPGIALTGEGKPIEPESTTVALRVKKP